MDAENHTDIESAADIRRQRGEPCICGLDYVVDDRGSHTYGWPRCGTNSSSNRRATREIAPANAVQISVLSACQGNAIRQTSHATPPNHLHSAAHLHRHLLIGARGAGIVLKVGIECAVRTYVDSRKCLVSGLDYSHWRQPGLCVFVRWLSGSKSLGAA